MAAKRSIADEWKSWVGKGGSAWNTPITGAAAAGGSGGSGGSKTADSAPGQSPLEWGIDIISRPLYALTGAVNQRLNNAKKSAVTNAVRVALGKEDESLRLGLEGAAPFLTDNKGVLEAAWKGLTSTDYADKKTGIDIIDNAASFPVEARGGTYEPRTFDNVREGNWGDFGLAAARGVGGFATDVALDPLTYGTFGVGTVARIGAKGVAKLLPSAERTVARALKAGEKASPVAARGVVEAAEEASPTAARTAMPAPTQTNRGALNVADTLTPQQLATAARQADSGSTFSRVSSGALPQLPKVSETLKSAHGGVVQALLKTGRELDKAAKTAREVAADAIPTPKKPSSKGANAAPAGLGDFARQFFGDADVVVGQLRAPGGGPWTPVTASSVIKGLSSTNPQQSRTFLNRLVAAANDPNTATPQLTEFLTAARAWSAEQRAARSASKGPSASASAPPAQAVDNLVDAPTQKSLLNSILRDARGKPTELGKELKAAVGPKLFNQLSSKRANEATQTRVLDELLQLARNADEVSPTTFDGMHENVRRFVEDTLQLRREDFDLVSRQKVLEQEMYAARPRLFNRETARGLDPRALGDASAATGMSAKQLRNHWETQARKIAGDAFDPSKNFWRGNVYRFTGKDGLKYSIIDSKISTNAFMDRVVGAVDKIDKSLPIPAGAEQPYSTSKTVARRAELPAAMRKTEQPFVDAGIRMGVNVGDEFVPMYPSHVYDGAEDFVRATRQELGDDAARAAQHIVDDILYNPGTAAPYTNLFEAAAAATRGADSSALDAILRGAQGRYTGKGYSKRTQLTEKGGRSRNQTFTADELRARTVDGIQRMAPFITQRMNGAMRQYAEKSLTDASAIATIIEREGAEAMSRGGQGAAMAHAADIEKRLVQLAEEYGASGHALGLAAEELAKELPPWLVQQAKQVRSTQTAYVNAARAGKTVPEMRKMGAASEARHTPVEVNAAIDDSARLAEDAVESGDPLWGMGTKATSVLKTEAENAALLGRFNTAFQSVFNQNYGGVVDGIRFRDYDRFAAGLAGKPIVQRGNDIGRWARKHDTPINGPDGLPTKETVASAAFKLLQDGAETLPPELLALPHGAHLAQALDELKPIASYFFDVPNSGLAGDKYWRGGAQNMRYLEEEMKRAGMNFDEVFERAALDGEIQSWWRNADVSDPGDFLHKYNEAVHRAEARRASMLMLTQRLRESGLISNTAKAGFAKPALQGDSFFYAGLQDAGVYVDKRVLEAMSEVDKMIFGSKGFKDSNLITTAFDPVMSAWKTGMTIMRPGHHIRNTLSNGMLSFVDQGISNLQKSGLQTARLMALREGDRGLAGISEAERLLTGQTSGLKGSGGQQVIHTSRLPGGKKLELTLDDFNDAFTKRGFFRTYQQSEDIVRGAGGIQKAADAVMLKGTPIGKAAAGLSEVLDHHGYVQHAMQIVMNNAHQVGRKFKTLDDLFDYATQRSYRFHPDSNVLTNFESKYMRRLFGFYMWFKGTLPAVLTSTIMSPGRVAVAHKASFNIAEMFGLDPQSYDNPWPEDADVPDFLKEGFFGANAEFGGQMYALNPGFAHNDLLKMFFGRGPEEGGDVGEAILSRAGRELLGMLNPMIKAPVELAADYDLQRGKAIRDRGDYVDSQLPYINYLTKSTGIGFTDNVTNLVGAIEQGRPHEVGNVDSGYQASIFDDGIGEQQHRTLLNWLLGQSGQKVNTKDQAAEQKELQKARRSAREEQGLPVSGSTGNSAASGASGAGSGTKLTTEELLKQLTLPDPVSTPARAELDIAAVDAIAETLMGPNGKPLTASQRLSAAKALQSEALGQQSSRYWTGYANGSLEQLASANPNLSVQELLAILRYTTPDPYRK